MEIGQVLAGRWVVREYLDRGGMARLYRGHDPRLGRDVAIKVLATSSAPAPGDVKRFQDEARAMGRVQHPNVLRVYDCDVTPEGELYTVMQLVRGRDLGRVIRALPAAPSLEDALRVFRQVSSGLHAVHERDIVHRDIKPANLLLEPARLDGTAFVGDFGVCKTLGQTHSGYFIGTADYMSREACLAEPVDRRSDIYSLGCTVFECLTGVRWNAPHRLSSDHVGPRLAALRPDLPSGVADVLESALADEPRDRYASAPAMLADLERARSRRTTVPSSGRSGPATLVEQNRQPAAAPSVAVARPPRRTAAVVAGVLAAVIAATTGVVAARTLSTSPGGTSGTSAVVAPTPGAPGPRPTADVGPQLMAPSEQTATSPGALPASPVSPRPLTDADRTLQARLAAGYGDCAPAELTERLTSFLDCRTAPDGLWSLQLRQFTSREAMDASFLEGYVRKADRFSSGRCADWARAPQAPGRGVISSWDRGGAACFVNVNGHAVVLWQFDDLALQVLAIRDDDDSTAVFDWWMEHRDSVLG